MKKKNDGVIEKGGTTTYVAKTLIQMVFYFVSLLPLFVAFYAVYCAGIPLKSAFVLFLVIISVFAFAYFFTCSMLIRKIVISENSSKNSFGIHKVDSAGRWMGEIYSADISNMEIKSSLLPFLEANVIIFKMPFGNEVKTKRFDISLFPGKSQRKMVKQLQNLYPKLVSNS